MMYTTTHKKVKMNKKCMRWRPWNVKCTFLFHEASDNWVNQDASDRELEISRVLFTMEIYRRKTLA